MDRSTALVIFGKLEEAREEPDGSWEPPTYDVRLDATTDVTDKRACRVRVTIGSSTGGFTEEQWRYVLDVAREEAPEDDPIAVTIQNHGIELD
jgi:hypothetical protein